MIRVVIDTNVLVSCLLFGGTPGALLNLWKSERLRLLMCRGMVDEFLKVLAYPKFKLAADDRQELLALDVEMSPVPALRTGGKRRK
mgnify:CR=1 FL=1